jgi:predicted permease
MQMQRQTTERKGKGFRYPVSASLAPQVWVPLQLEEKDRERDSAESYFVLARLRRGVTVSRAQAEVTLIQKRVGAEYADAEMGKDHSAVNIRPYAETLVDIDTRKALLALLAAAGVLWLIASVNVTNLLLARSTARQREIAMRGALGASRWRITQQMMVEGLLLSGIAGVLGIGLAMASVKLLAHELSQHLPLPVPATPDRWILLALVGMTVVSALLSTAWPALMAARAPIEPALKQGGLQTGTGRRHNRMRAGLVAAEIAMSLTLLVVCGLLLRTIYALRHVPLGFRTDHIIVASLNIPSFRFAGRNMTADLYEPMLERVQHLHGVQAAGLMTDVPLGRNFLVTLTLSEEKNQVGSFFKAVTPEIQQVFGMRMMAGRFFDAQDTPTSQPVVVVNRAFAVLHSPDKHNPMAILGTKLINLRKNASTRIIGILDDERQRSVGWPPQPEVEIAIPQITPDSTFYQVTEGIAMDLAVRTQQPTAEMIPELRQILKEASPELEGATITTMDQIVEDSYGSQRLAAHLLEIFGGSALLLCVAGLYGLLAYVVTQRTRELGLRIALGAQRGNLLWLVMRQAGGMLVVGVVMGLGLAWASGKLVGGFLYGVKAHDGWTLAGAAMLLFMSGMLAAYLPARRAAGVDPMEALRAE